MEQPNQQLEDLHEIRSLMERSARFISLSGLSGICAGIFAIAGAFITYQHFRLAGLHSGTVYRQADDHIFFLAGVASVVMVLSVAAGILFTIKNAKRKGQKIWDRNSRSMLINLAIPLLAGGVFCLLLLYHAPELIAGTMLVFYGMALLNASKYTLNDIRYLGIFEIILGLICGFYPGFGLLFWAIGFGLLHIVYGTVMYLKYER